MTSYHIRSTKFESKFHCIRFEDSSRRKAVEVAINIWLLEVYMHKHTFSKIFESKYAFVIFQQKLLPCNLDLLKYHVINKLSLHLHLIFFLSLSYFPCLIFHPQIYKDIFFHLSPNQTRTHTTPFASLFFNLLIHSLVLC